MSNIDPVTGVSFNYEEGSDGWTDSTNYNWKTLAFFAAMPYVIDVVDTLPTSPTTGDRYAHGAFLSAYIGSEWFTIPAKEGYNLFNKATGKPIAFNGSEWVPVVPEATAETTSYDPSVSGLTAENVQDAVDEVVDKVGSLTALDISYDTTGGSTVQAVLDANEEAILSHASNASNPHSVTKTQVGLSNVDNTSDANKPISTATQTALDTKMTASAYTGAFGNLNTPLLNLPLKKNLLTAQGRSVATFSRASGATHIDRYGVIKSDGTDSARFSKDGLLIEPSATNILLQSQDFDNASWGKNECTITANTTATTDPSGTNLADKLIPSTALTGHYVSQTLTPTLGTVYTFSCFAKKGEYNYLGLLFPYGSAQFPTLSVAVFDLNTGTVALVQNATLVAKIEPFANGWYRCSITETCTASISGQFSIRAYPSSTPTPYSGDGTSGIYIFGAQLETGFSSQTSYIPTTTSAATRAYDSLSIPQAENVPYYANNLSFCIDYIPRHIGTISHTLVSDDSDVSIVVSSTGGINVTFGTATISYAAGLVKDTKYRICLTKTATTLTLYINGVSVATTAVGTLPINQTSLFIGSEDGSTNSALGFISNLRIYDFAMTAEEVRLA